MLIVAYMIRREVENLNYFGSKSSQTTKRSGDLNASRINRTQGIGHTVATVQISK